MHLRNIFFCIILLFFSCRTKKIVVIPPTANVWQSLEDQIHRFIDCLNEQDFDCVASCYADDFTSFSPLVHFENKAALMKSIRKNYTENNYRLEVQIGEVDAGQEHGHAILRWKMFSKNKQLEEELVYDKMNFTVWKRTPTTDWQLSRMLFFLVEKQ